MGKVRTGKWFVHSDDLCLDLPEPDGGCFEVTRGNEAVKRRELMIPQEVTTHFCCRLRHRSDDIVCWTGSCSR